jgi:hypothetical protein
MKENLLFTSAGDNTKFYDLWCLEDRNYDIFICYYGDDDHKYQEYSDHYLKRKGSKMQNFHYVWNTYDDVLIKNYKNYYIVDDDIIISTNEINELFNLLNELNVWILQPSFSFKSHVSHGITKQKKDSKYRYTNFIEINTPFFSNYAITECMKVYDPILVGYGIDILFMWTLGTDKEDKYVIVDYISCVNPIRIKREIDKLQIVSTRIENWNKIQEILRIPNIKHKNFSIVR